MPHSHRCSTANVMKPHYTVKHWQIVFSSYNLSIYNKQLLFAYFVLLHIYFKYKCKLDAITFFVLFCIFTCVCSCIINIIITVIIITIITYYYLCYKLYYNKYYIFLHKTCECVIHVCCVYTHIIIKYIYNKE